MNEDAQITIDELVKRLTDLQETGDPEAAHCEADDLLIQYIGSPEVSAAYGAIHKWYS